MTRPELNAYILAQLPDNILKLITPQNHRNVEAAILDYVDLHFDDLADWTVETILSYIGEATDLWEAALAAEALARTNADVTHGIEIANLNDNKLNISDYVQHFRGAFGTVEDLTSDVADPVEGDYASVYTGDDLVRYNWNSSISVWVPATGATTSDHYRGAWGTIEDLVAGVPTGNEGDYADVYDGDPMVRYVWNNLTETWVAPPAGASTVIYETRTRAEIETFIGDAELEPGRDYLVTENDCLPVNLGIVIRAISPTKLSPIGVATFPVPDFAALETDISANPNFAGCPIAPVLFRGPWSVALEGALVDGDVVCRDGKNFQVTTAGSMDGTGPDPDNIANGFTPLEFDAPNVGYVLNFDTVKHDFATNTFPMRIDSLGNFVESPTGVAVFQWGNPLVAFNRVTQAAAWDCLNQKGLIKNNSVRENVQLTTDNTHTGEIQWSEFAGSTNITLNKNGSVFQRCKMVTSRSPIVIDSGPHQEGRELSYTGSNFDGVVNVAGSDTIDLDTDLTRYLGLITIVGQDMPVDKINVPALTWQDEFYFELRSQTSPIILSVTQSVNLTTSGQILKNTGLDSVSIVDDPSHQRFDFLKCRTRIINNGSLFSIIEILSGEYARLNRHPRKLRLLVNQGSTSDPTATVLEDTVTDAGLAWSLHRDSAGTYYVQFDPGSSVSLARVFYYSPSFINGNSTQTFGGVWFGVGAFALFQFATRNSGTLTDGMLTNHPLELTLYVDDL